MSGSYCVCASGAKEYSVNELSNKGKKQANRPTRRLLFSPTVVWVPLSRGNFVTLSVFGLNFGSITGFELNK